MKQRIISALVGLLLLAVVFTFLDTMLLNVMMAALSAIAVWELLSAVKCVKFKGMTAVALLFAALIPFAQEKLIRVRMPQFIFILVIVFFILLIRFYDKIRFEQAAMCFLISLFVPSFFACGVYIRNYYGPEIGGFYLIWALGSAWLCDSGAYFTGVYFGKHKMAPRISPKKTVEGAVGGVVTASLVMLLFGYLFTLGTELLLHRTVYVNYLALGLLTPFFAVMGMFGDLSASVIKRQFGVKDYGNIMPGHGGVMDRFDSAMFTLPSVFIVVQHVAVAMIEQA